MNLVLRYVEAVKNELPKHNRDDIAKELQSTLEDELEALHGNPTEAQQAAFLERRGHPVLTASHYWTRRSLIGEEVYPLYRQALVLVCSAYLALSVLLNVGDFYVLRDWTNPGKILNILFDIFGSVVFAAGVLTVVFHFFGSEIAQQKWLWHFRAQNLPDVGSQAAYIRREETMGSLLGNLIGLSFLTFGVVTFRNLEIRADWTPIGGVIEVLRFLLLTDLALNLLHLIQPYWTRAKLWFSTVLSVALMLCLSIILLAPEVVSISGGQAADPNTLVWLATSVKITVGVFLAVVAWSAFETLRRVSRLRLPHL